mgnify:CR=1 FL=1
MYKKAAMYFGVHHAWPGRAQLDAFNPASMATVVSSDPSLAARFAKDRKSELVTLKMPPKPVPDNNPGLPYSPTLPYYSGEDDKDQWESYDSLVLQENPNSSQKQLD